MEGDELPARPRGCSERGRSPRESPGGSAALGTAPGEAAPAGGTAGPGPGGDTGLSIFLFLRGKE